MVYFYKGINSIKNYNLLIKITQLHIHIMNIKGWLRGIHHKCKGNRLQNYLDEFHFRFNRRCYLNSILDKLIFRAVDLQPIPYKKIKVCELNT